jgi:hypothetical protein
MFFSTASLAPSALPSHTSSSTVSVETEEVSSRKVLSNIFRACGSNISQEVLSITCLPQPKASSKEQHHTKETALRGMVPKQRRVSLVIAFVSSRGFEGFAPYADWFSIKERSL